MSALLSSLGMNFIIQKLDSTGSTSQTVALPHQLDLPLGSLSPLSPGISPVKSSTPQTCSPPSNPRWDPLKFSFHVANWCLTLLESRLRWKFLAVSEKLTILDVNTVILSSRSYFDQLLNFYNFWSSLVERFLFFVLNFQCLYSNIGYLSICPYRRPDGMKFNIKLCLALVNF